MVSRSSGDLWSNSSFLDRYHVYKSFTTRGEALLSKQVNPLAVVQYLAAGDTLTLLRFVLVEAPVDR